MYDSKYNFSDSFDIGKHVLPLTTKYDKFLSFYHRSNEFRNLAPRIKEAKYKKGICMTIL